MRIPPDAADHLVRHGYAVVPDFLAADELAAARRNMARYFPSPDELAATPERYGFVFDDPEHLQVEFPFAGDALNDITAENGVRLSHHLVWRAAAYPFAGYHQWSRFGENALLERFIERTTPRQREVLGFPPPGHPYWNDQTLAGVAARYPKMDMTPYRAAAK